MGKRRFGRVRALSSGRFQARYRGPDGVDRPADRTFATKTDAEVWLTRKEAEIHAGDWRDPNAGKIPFADYAKTWIADRVIKRRTEELYESLLRLHLAPTFGETFISDIREADVRRWRKKALNGGTGAVTVAKAYRLLRAILNTATDDELIRRNPCRIKGAGREESPERPTVPVSTVFELASEVPPRFRMLVLLATFAGLRWGELAGLRRGDIDLTAGTVRVDEALSELNGGYLVEDTPKSRAGLRTVAIPSFLTPDLGRHIDTYAEKGTDGLVFVGPKGGRMRRRNFQTIWSKARTEVGVPYLHFHDLRHTGNTMAAATGASLRELMARMGHSSARAALIYQHATSDRDKAIADALGRMVDEQTGNDGHEEKDGDEPLPDGHDADPSGT